MKKIIITFLTAVLLTGLSACVKEKFAAPPATDTDPDITANTTIASLAAAASTAPSGGGIFISTNSIISAVVVGDDKSGNLYKELAIEDSTGGIMLMINSSDLYATYPVGRRVFVQLQGLYIANYEGTFEIVASVTGGTLTGISLPNLPQYVIPGKWGIVTAPKILTVPQFLANMNGYQSELIELNNVEFIVGNRGVPYANATYELSGTLDIKDCNENQVAVYTSGYANFAGSLSPSGNGTMVCIAGVYAGSTGTTAQIMIRDTTDISLTGSVCP